MSDDNYEYVVKNERTREKRSVIANTRAQAIERSGFSPLDVRWAWAVPGTKGAVSVNGNAPEVAGKDDCYDKGESVMAQSAKKSTKSNSKSTPVKKVAKSVGQKSADRSAAAKKAWVTIRANRAKAAKANGAKGPSASGNVPSVNKSKRPRNKKKS